MYGYVLRLTKWSINHIVGMCMPMLKILDPTSNPVLFVWVFKSGIHTIKNRRNEKAEWRKQPRMLKVMYVMNLSMFYYSLIEIHGTVGIIILRLTKFCWHFIQWVVLG